MHVIVPAFSSEYGTFVETHDGSKMTVHRIKSYRVISHKTLRFVWPFTLKKKTDEILRLVQPDAVHVQSHLIVGRYLIKSAKQKQILNRSYFGWLRNHLHRKFPPC